jgi:hypothetical protein
MSYRIAGVVLLGWLLFPLSSGIPEEMSPLTTTNHIAIESFNKADVGRLPKGWNPYKEEGNGIYRVRVEGERVFVEAKAAGLAVQLTKEITLHTEKNPFLRWEWRMHQLPTGGDEREKKTNDSGAGVYVFFNKGWPKMRKYTLKYVWSATDLAKGSYYKGHYNPNMYTIIQQNHDMPSNQWIPEKVNMQTALYRICSSRYVSAHRIPE